MFGTKGCIVANFLTLALLLTSCASSTIPAAGLTAVPEKATPASSAGPFAAASPTHKPAPEQPRGGGILTTTLNADMTSFDVQQDTGLLVHATVQSCYSGLLQFDPANPDQIIADLAERWEANRDGTEYTFRLHKGVKFHDGSDLTAKDVKLSLERIYDPPRGVVSPRKTTVSSINGVAAVDEATVKLSLKYAQGSLLPMLAVGQMVVYPQRVVEVKGNMRKDIVGTGPFMFRDYSLGTVFEVKKNPSYFVRGRPYLDGIRFYVIKDASTRLAAFRTGQVKLIDPSHTSGLLPGQAGIIRQEMPQGKLAKYPSVTVKLLNMVVTIPPFDDIRVRRAVSLALDRQAAVKIVALGEADIGSNFVPGSDWALPEEELLRQPGYGQPKDRDIAEAKRLLAEAGFDRGFKTQILARARYTDDLAVLIKQQLAKIGIELELVVQESAVFLETNRKLIYPMVSQPNGVRVSDPDEFSRYFHSGGDQRQTNLKNDEVDSLFDRQSQATDTAQRRKLVRELEMKLLQLASNVVVYWDRGNIAFWPEVRNYYRGSIYNNNKYQDVWLAK
ncbi:MAG: hypothetical protein HYX92_04065 [Chloroflexi bacterium]|nr:hypothetical protein [Chloroflexota bacterium]